MPKSEKKNESLQLNIAIDLEDVTWLLVDVQITLNLKAEALSGHKESLAKKGLKSVEKAFETLKTAKSLSDILPWLKEITKICLKLLE